MTTLVQETSKLTDRNQTTVPSGVRKQLKLGKGDRIRYCTDPGGRIYIEADRDDANDPALRAFLGLIEADIEAHPARLQAFDGGLHDRLKALIGNVADDLDLDAPLAPEDE